MQKRGEALAFAAMVAALGALGISCGQSSSPGRAATQATGGDTGVVDASGNTGSAQTEQTLAVDPTNPDNVVIGFINGVSVSHDGGRTWTLAQKADGTAVSCAGDNNPAFDNSGMAYFECDNNGVEFYKSNHASEPWAGPFSAVGFTQNNGDLVDRPFLIHGVGSQDLVVGWESFFSNPVGWVYTKVSHDGGATWSAPVRVDDMNDHPAVQDPREFPVVGADGTIYVAYASGQAPFVDCRNCGALPIDYIVARSTDGGATFQRVVVAPNIARTDSPDEEAEYISALAADPEPKRARHLALAWSDERNKITNADGTTTNVSRIFVSTSIDGGLTWSDPFDVADDPLEGHANHDHVQIAFAPDGRLIAVWRDTRCCGTGWASPVKYNVYARALAFNGLNGVLTPEPGPAVRVTDADQDFNANTKSNEYLGMAVGPEGVSIAWNQVHKGAGTGGADVAATTYRRIPLP